MRYLYILLVFCLSLSYACDEDSNSNNDNIETSCFIPEDVAESNCPAEELTNMCTTYSCSFTIGDIVADGPFPPCPGDVNSCEFIDCTRLVCGTFVYFNISAGDGALIYSFDSTDSQGQPIEVNVTCFTGGLFNFTCGDNGTIFN